MNWIVTQRVLSISSTKPSCVGPPVFPFIPVALHNRVYTGTSANPKPNINIAIIISNSGNFFLFKKNDVIYIHQLWVGKKKYDKAAVKAKSTLSRVRLPKLD